MNCSRCAAVLQPEIYEGVDVDRCVRCGGVWLDEGELREIVKIREKRFSPEQVRLAKKKVFSAEPPREHDGPIPCPKCSKTMTRFTYAGTKGLVLDKCPGHGIWFDKDELEQAQIIAEECGKLLLKGNKPKEEKEKKKKKTGFFSVLVSWFQ